MQCTNMKYVYEHTHHNFLRVKFSFKFPHIPVQYQSENLSRQKQIPVHERSCCIFQTHSQLAQCQTMHMQRHIVHMQAIHAACPAGIYIANCWRLIPLGVCWALKFKFVQVQQFNKQLVMNSVVYGSLVEHCLSTYFMYLEQLQTFDNWQSLHDLACMHGKENAGKCGWDWYHLLVLECSYLNPGLGTIYSCRGAEYIGIIYIFDEEFSL